MKGFIIDSFMFKDSALFLVVRTVNNEKIALQVTDFHPYFLFEKSPNVLLHALEVIHDHSIPNVIVEASEYNVNACEKREFVKVSAKTKRELVDIKAHLASRKVTIFNFEESPEYQLFNDINLDPSLVIEFEPTSSYSRNGIRICEVSLKKIKNVTQKEHDILFEALNVQVLGFDIEVVSSDELFPDARRPGDKVIAVSFCKGTIQGFTDSELYIAYVGKEKVLTSEDMARFNISRQICCENELMLLEFVLSEITNTDLLFDFNGTGFDLPYIITRYEKIYKKELIKFYPFSTLFYENFGKRITTFGRIHLDLLSVFKSRDADKNKENSLNFLSMKYLRNEIISVKDKVIVCKPLLICKGMMCDVTFDVVEDIHRLHANLRVLSVQHFPDRTEVTVDKVLTAPVENKFLSLVKDDVDITKIKTYHSDRELYRQVLCYCVNDTRLTKYLIEKQNLLTTYVLKANIRSLILRDSIVKGNSFLNQAMITRVLVNRGWAMQIKSGEATDDDKYEGATVLTPIAGKHERVFVLDFSSLYPSIMIAFNICMTTLVTQDVKEKLALSDDLFHKITTEKEPLYFYKAHIKKGVVPQFCESFINSRNAIKTEMKNGLLSLIEKILLDIKQKNIKVANNSVYGSLGDSSSTHFNRFIASGITAIGREYLGSLKVFFEKFGFLVIGGDTDSIFIKQRDDSVDEQLLGEVIDEFNLTLPPPMCVEKEKMYSVLFLGSKKKRRYGIVQKGEDFKVEIKGFLSIKRDTPEVVKMVEQKIFDILLKSQDYEADVVSYIKQTVENIEKINLDFFTCTKTINNPEAYKDKNTPHLALAVKCAELGYCDKPKMGDKISYLHIKELRGNKYAKDKILTVKMMQSHNYSVDYGKYKKDIYSMVLQIIEDVLSTKCLLKIKTILDA